MSTGSDGPGRRFGYSSSRVEHDESPVEVVESMISLVVAEAGVTRDWLLRRGVWRGRTGEGDVRAIAVVFPLP